MTDRCIIKILLIIIIISFAFMRPISVRGSVPTRPNLGPSTYMYAQEKKRKRVDHFHATG